MTKIKRHIRCVLKSWVLVTDPPTRALKYGVALETAHIVSECAYRGCGLCRYVLKNSLKGLIEYRFYPKLVTRKEKVQQRANKRFWKKFNARQARLGDEKE